LIKGIKNGGIMNTSKIFRTSFNLDDLLKRVEHIVDEQINELGKGKNSSSDNQLMKEDFARGNPYSPNSRQVDDKSPAVFSKLGSEENQKTVSNLADRLKENICRAIDEYSEGLYNQLQAAPCRCGEKVCHHPAGEKAEQDGISAVSEEIPEVSPPQGEDVTETLVSPPTMEEAPTEEVITAEMSPPQVEDVTEIPVSPPTMEEAPTEEVITAEMSPPQVEDVTEDISLAPTPEETPQQGALFSSSFNFGQSAVEQPATPDTNDHSEDDLACSDPSMEGTSPADSKAATEVDKAAADMEQINKQRLDQYFAKKVKFSV
jgi:hypothetical protein